ncbi:ATP-dependent DNA helicase MER3, partial [Entophlyctis luteolus]
MDIMQMMGRAGRPKFDDSGTVVVMTSTDKQQKYQQMVSGSQIIESGLHENLIEHLNAEICLGTIRNVELCIGCLCFLLQSTFLNVRISQNPSRYKLSASAISLSSLCLKDLTALANAGLIEQHDEGMTFVPTDLGRAMAKFYVKFETARSLIMDLPRGATIRKFLEILSKAAEFAEVKYRNDKTYLNGVNREVRFPISGKLKGANDKVNLLIQCSLGSVKFAEQKLQNILNLDTNVVMKHAERLSRFAFEVCVIKKDFSAAESALDLANSISVRAWEQNGHHLKQIESIGPVQAKLLFDAGVKTITDFLMKKPEDIELVKIYLVADIIHRAHLQILNKNRLVGNKLLQFARSFPQLNMIITQVQPYTNNEIEFFVNVFLENPATVKISGKRGMVTAVFMAGVDHVEGDLIDFRRLTMREIQNGKRFSIKFTKRHTAVNVKFILVAEEFVGIRITKSVTVECARTGRGKQSNAVIAKDGRAMEEASNAAEPFAAPAEQSRPDGNISDFGDDFDFDWDEIMEITQNVGTVTVAAEHGQLPTKQQPLQIMDGTSSAGPQTPITPKREPCAHKCARKD